MTHPELSKAEKDYFFFFSKHHMKKTLTLNWSHVIVGKRTSIIHTGDRKKHRLQVITLWNKG